MIFKGARSPTWVGALPKTALSLDQRLPSPDLVAIPDIESPALAPGFSLASSPATASGRRIGALPCHLLEAGQERQMSGTCQGDRLPRQRNASIVAEPRLSSPWRTSTGWHRAWPRLRRECRSMDGIASNAALESYETCESFAEMKPACAFYSRLTAGRRARTSIWTPTIRRIAARSIRAPEL